jgi:hypothetical protein
MRSEWRFDRLWAFEPTSACLPALREFADERVEIVHAGLWSSGTEMDIYDPGTLHGSVDSTASRAGTVERCRFLDASAWMAQRISDDDEVWMKINIEAAEIEVLSRLLDTGQIDKVNHLVVHFDVEKVGRGDEAASMRRRLDASGVAWREARDVMFGRTASAKAASWLAFTHGQRRRWWRGRIEHSARHQIFRARRRLRLV